MLSDNKTGDNWRTPLSLFNKLNTKYNFDVDLCASDDYHLCKTYYTKDNSCLDKYINNKVVFCNPPYSNIRPFVQFCSNLFNDYNCKCVLVLPVWSDSSWFHDFILDKKGVRIEFIKGRVYFSEFIYPCKFPVMIVYMGC